MHIYCRGICRHLQAIITSSQSLGINAPGNALDTLLGLMILMEKQFAVWMQEMMPRWHDDLVDHFGVGLDPEARLCNGHKHFLNLFLNLLFAFSVLGLVPRRATMAHDLASYNCLFVTTGAGHYQNVHQWNNGRHSQSVQGVLSGTRWDHIST